ncbi:MAG: cbb3-type cytochrome c oxidase subunit I [Magnetospiraceae bacterium]
MTATPQREPAAWAALSVAALGLAGVFALLLAMSRAPVLQDLLPWPWETFFYKALVTHVVFSFVYWLLGMLAHLASAALTEAGAPAGPFGSWVGPGLAGLGGICLAVPALADLGSVDFSDYVPVVDHPLFLAGLMMLALGVSIPVMRLLLRPDLWRADPVTGGVAASGFLFLLAVLTGAITGMRLPDWLGEAAYFERLFWGAGHLLQFVYTGLLLVVWAKLAGAPPGGRLYAASFLAMAAVGLFGPVIALMLDPAGPGYRDGFTRLFWFGLVLPPLLVGGALAMDLRRRPGWFRAATGPALLLTLLLFGLGGLLGYALGVADTRTPAHYHAVTGAVNLALMTYVLVLLPAAWNRAGPRPKTLRWLAWFYGMGQMLHALGLFAAGSLGVPRKVAGAEQGLDSLVKQISMGGAGIGGLLAVVGGILFIWLAIRLLMRREAAP